MPNWPISDEASLLASSAASLSRKALVPERAMVPSAWVRSSRVMPMPLSEKVSGLGVGIDRDLDREGRAVLDEFRLGDQLVAQLLAGVGGVGDQFADENLPVGIDRMDHEVQQARNVGLEALGLRLRWSGSGRRRSKANLSKNVEIGNPAETARRTAYRGDGCGDASIFQRWSTARMTFP